MKILITGSNGQLGSELQELSAQYPEWDFLFTDERELDITDESGIDDFFSSSRPDIVINCAAYTAVDKAETDVEKAFLINSVAAGVLARATSKYGALLIHISTDYVFDGQHWIPYSEEDAINPRSAYGKSKAAGEEAIHQFASKAIIIRTAWLYSSYGNNFVKTMLRYGKEKGLLNVVFDQTGTPTYARDLARTILQVLPSSVQNQGVEVFHYSNEGVISWYDFAKAIMEISGVDCKIKPIYSAEYPQAAPRPFYSVLNKNKIKQRFSLEIPYWRDSLKECIDKLSF